MGINGRSEYMSATRVVGTCGLARACKRGRNNKIITFSPILDDYKKQAKENLSSDLGMRCRANNRTWLRKCPLGIASIVWV